MNPSTPIPYAFLPINPEEALLDAPLWRDGSSVEDRLSGELLLTLTAKTPLIVGNHSHKVDDKHSALAPQMISKDDDRVLLGASSLKGMLRAALSGLLQAPMEKVSEHHYTYRPNLGFDLSDKPKREQRAAIIQSVEGEGESAKVSVKILPKNCAVVFVKGEAKTALGDTKAGEHIKRTVQNVQLIQKPNRANLISAKGNQETLSHHYFSYKGGMDGEGHLAKAFAESNRRTADVSHAVLISDADFQAGTQKDIPLSVDIRKGYYETQRILADDKYGHLSPGHPLEKHFDKVETQRAIKNNDKPEKGQLIYIEQGLNEKGVLSIVSMGHHFQYRWGYTSSVRYKNRLLDGKGVLRKELDLHPSEKAGTDGAPEKLTGARLLFGYTVDGDEQKALADKNFKRLAGRVAFNTAVEVPHNKTLDERFVKSGGAVSLQILGMPRPSAVEFYIKQENLPHKLTTYGDLPSEEGGDLAGRKRYRHQPDAAKSPIYSPGKTDANATERGTVVHYLSKEGSQFRCTLRFDSLRPWELGALLSALNPELIADRFDIKHTQGYAHKLGYGKPLGLGSVQIKIDKARWQENDSWGWTSAESTEKADTAWQAIVDKSLKAFKEKLDFHLRGNPKPHLERWLKALQWSGQGRARYPDLNGKIFDYHTDLRRRHAKARRGNGSNSQEFKDLKELLENKMNAKL